MNINASNHSLPNIITRTLMGRREKRPTFEEVYKSISKNSAKMNSKMPLNSSLTNEQMYRCYVQNTVPKLQKSNDTFGETELNTVLMKLLGNDPSGNALTPTPLTTVAAAPSALTSAPSAPTGIPLPPPPPPPPSGTSAPLPPSGTSALPPPAPSATSAPPPAPSATSAPPPSAPSGISAPLPSAPASATLASASTTLTPLIIPPAMSAAQPAQSPVIAVATGLGASVMNLASSFFGTTTAQPPPPPPAPILSPAAAGATFVSTTPPAPDALKLARQMSATRALAAFNIVGLQQVINTRGAPLKPTADPLEKEISAANQLLAKIRKEKINPDDLTGELKINYDRSTELRRQVAQKLSLEKGAKQVKKAATLATKKEKEIRRDSSLSQAATSAGSSNPETKAQKQSRIQSEKEAAKALAKARALAAIGGNI